MSGGPWARAWVRYFVLLVAVWLLVVAMAAAALVRARAHSRAAEEQGFRQRGRVAASFISTYATRMPDRQRGWADATLNQAQVSAGELSVACQTIGFTACGLFDSHARLLMNAPYLKELIGKSFTSLQQVSQSLRTHQPTITPVSISPALKAPVVAFGLPFQTRWGMRVFTGIFSVQDSALVRDANVSFELPTTQIYVIDNAGNLAASTRTKLPEVMTPLGSYDRSLGAGLQRHPHGSIGSRYYSADDIRGTPWRLVSTVSDSALYRSIGTVASVSLWAVAGWAIVGLATILALIRALHRQERATAHLDAIRSHGVERQRYAREVNDDIVQGLVAAQGALDLGDTERARRLLTATSRNARQWIGELLTEAGPLRPGDARRRSAPAQAEPAPTPPDEPERPRAGAAEPR